MESKKNFNYVTFGTKSNVSEVKEFINHIIGSGSKKRAGCIWGMHGIGKTAIVEQIAKENDMQFAYIAPAQFEEMGDLVGMPMIKDGKTTFAAPDWVPSDDGKPGILLIDDANRADSRILNGIMQLIQNYELVSWKLPENWHIILTANPDGGDYSVTPMDDAQLTRMVHITMKFDEKEWAKWALENGIDGRVVNWVLMHPEMAKNGNRTNPRTIVQFADLVGTIDDISSKIGLVQSLATGTMDEEAVASFISFAQGGMQKLLHPEELLCGEWPVTEKKLNDIYTSDGGFRQAAMATMVFRLINYMIGKTETIKAVEKYNLTELFNSKFLTNDLKALIAKESAKNSNLREVLSIEAIRKATLSAI